MVSDASQKRGGKTLLRSVANRASGPSRKRPRSGITLLEVILAMAILLMSLAAIGKLVDMGSERAVETQSQARGTRLAHSKMAEVEAGVIGVTGAANGTFDDEPDWSWSVEPEAEGTPNLYKVTVRASRTLRGKPFEVALSQWLMDPQQMGSASQAQTSSSSGTTSSSGTSAGTTGGSP